MPSRGSGARTRCSRRTSGSTSRTPTAATKAALTSFADQAATLYWNPNVGGYGYYPGMTGATANVYYDDSGWWGLAFIDTYNATHNPKYLAERAAR